jgi:hypothetical protein
MSNFFKKFIDGGNVVPPHHIEKEFNHKFIDPLNVEWFLKGKQYEAVFYKDNTEYIARYTSEGLLIDYKINLPVDNLPEKLCSKLPWDEEIMNVVSIDSGKSTEYEIIVRDKNLQRYLIQIADNGKIINRKAL